jgi:RNA polymerase sigma-70 factor (ECF subfamily)
MVNMKAAAAEGEAADEASHPPLGIAGFALWMASEQRRIYRLCLRMLGSDHEADSATQDAFLKAFRTLQRSPETVIEDPAKWLTRIAVNTCLDQLRSRRWQFWRRRPSAAEEAAAFERAQANSTSAEDLLAARDLSRRITAALEKLSSRQRAVFVLRHEDGKSLDEIGELLNLDVGTVKGHMGRALRKLREELKDLYAF